MFSNHYIRQVISHCIQIRCNLANNFHMTILFCDFAPQIFLHAGPDPGVVIALSHETE